MAANVRKNTLRIKNLEYKKTFLNIIAWTFPLSAYIQTS